MFAKSIMMTAIALLLTGQSAFPQTYEESMRNYNNMRKVHGEPGEQRSEPDDSGECGFGCALVGVTALAAFYAYMKQRQEENARRNAQRAGPPPPPGSQAYDDDETWRVKNMGGDAVDPLYLTVYSDSSIRSQRVARLAPGFSGIHLTGGCVAADETRGMCPIFLPTRRGNLVGWMVGDIIEKVPTDQ